MKCGLRICLVSGGLAAATACGSDGDGYPSEQPLVDGTGGETTGSLAEGPGTTDEGSNEPVFTEETCLWSYEYVVQSSLTDTRGTGFSALEVLAIVNETQRGAITWQRDDEQDHRHRVRPGRELGRVG